MFLSIPDVVRFALEHQQLPAICDDDLRVHLGSDLPPRRRKLPQPCAGKACECGHGLGALQRTFRALKRLHHDVDGDAALGRCQQRRPSQWSVRRSGSRS
jgi:hypothetical protein